MGRLRILLATLALAAVLGGCAVDEGPAPDPSAQPIASGDDGAPDETGLDAPDHGTDERFPFDDDGDCHTDEAPDSEETRVARPLLVILPGDVLPIGHGDPSPWRLPVATPR